MNHALDNADSTAVGPSRHRRCDLVALTSALLPLLDVLSVLFAGYLSARIYAFWLAPTGLTVSAWSGYECTALIAAAMLAAVCLYDQKFGARASRGQRTALLRRYTLGFLLFAGATLVVAFASRALDTLPSAWATLWFGLSLLLTLLARMLLARAMRSMERQGFLTEVIAVVGAGPLADRLISHLRQTRGSAIEVLGVFDDTPTISPTGSPRPAGTVADLVALSTTRSIDWIVLTLPCTVEDPLDSLVQRLKDLAAPVVLCPQNFGLTLPSQVIDYVGDGVPVTLLADRPIRRWDAVTKSLEDLVLGALITLVLLPVLILVAVAIRLDSAGPIIFKQRRHTCNNREFEVYKFRTMRWSPVQTTDLKQTARDDDRITRLGRLLRASSLDELPQLFNVLQGDMSLVGPRPHAVNMRTENQLGGEITDTYAHRHRVKPGMTGWSQVNGSRGATDTTEQLRRRVELDLRYVDNWSLQLDLKILLLTVPEVLKRTNAY